MTAADTYHVTYEGATVWQVMVVAIAAAAAVLVLDRLWDHAVDAWFDWRERRRDDPIDDASDDTRDERFTGPRTTTPLRWRASSTVIHRAHCQYAQTLPPITVWSEDAAKHWAMAHGQYSCARCEPFDAPTPASVMVGERDE